MPIVEKGPLFANPPLKGASPNGYPASSNGQGSANSTPLKFSFHGDASSIFGIYLRNLLYIVLTLGIYSLWNKVKVRNYIYSQTEFDGERFAYHGTGKELFLGLLKATLVIGVPYFALRMIASFWHTPWVTLSVGALIWLGIIFIVPVATIGKWKYKLSRSSFRGIRFSFRGNIKDYMKPYFSGLFLTFITVGLYSPFYRSNLRKYLIEHSYFGNVPFEYDGMGEDLFGRYVLSVFLACLTFGIYWFKFSAERERYYWAHTSFKGIRFGSTVTGRGLLNLFGGNILIALFTLGLGMPWITVRELRFQLGNLQVEEAPDLNSVKQEAKSATAFGEEVGAFLEIDGSLGLL